MKERKRKKGKKRKKEGGKREVWNYLLLDCEASTDSPTPEKTRLRKKKPERQPLILKKMSQPQASCK
ncbi:hypothetical protein KIN20_018986 [Parelaphostrongylus tenuis]|uniref:Uncharacterized protein n=1 Tax=Parelaphostrongylus tenuis TaxID=148309 RepID=A0AAD5N1Q0_PARTN|nr:hypothetical protein KIN20_018986 [Parelaphostrongylus tenuis]